MIKCLIFSGGGYKGLSYLGIVKFLEEKDLLKNITGFYGTSIGAILATLISIGYTYTELKYCINKLNIENLIDINTLDINHMFEKWGLIEPNKFYLLIKLLIEKKIGTPNITFTQHYKTYGKNLIITGSNITKMCAEYFSHTETPDMLIHDAIKISTCIPIIFKPIVYNNNHYLDGAIYDNYPFQYAKKHYPKTDILGIHINYSSDKTERQLDCFEVFIKSIILCLIHNIDNSEYKRYDDYTVKITPNNQSIISVNVEDIDKTIDIGYTAISEYYNDNQRRFVELEIKLNTIDYKDILYI
jgi:predicted acylesterase/phospholipase RssA